MTSAEFLHRGIIFAECIFIYFMLYLTAFGSILIYRQFSAWSSGEKGLE